MRDKGEWRSEYDACVQGANVVSEAVDHGTMLPAASLHFKVTALPYSLGDAALDATAADQINYQENVNICSPDLTRDLQLTTLGAVK